MAQEVERAAGPVCARHARRPRGPREGAAADADAAAGERRVQQRVGGLACMRGRGGPVEVLPVLRCCMNGIMSRAAAGD